MDLLAFAIILLLYFVSVFLNRSIRFIQEEKEYCNHAKKVEASCCDELWDEARWEQHSAQRVMCVNAGV